jgi:hypothetical protein
MFSFKKVSNRNYIFYKLNEDKPIIYQINSPIVYLPFGIENYNNKQIMNIDIKSQDKTTKPFLDTLIKLDVYFRDNIKEIIPELEGLEYVSPIKKRNNIFNNYLIRTNIKKRGNMISTKCYENNEEITIFEIKKKSHIKLKLEICNLWIYNNKYGITLDVVEIKV